MHMQVRRGKTALRSFRKQVKSINKARKHLQFPNAKIVSNDKFLQFAIKLIDFLNIKLKWERLNQKLKIKSLAMENTACIEKSQLFNRWASFHPLPAKVRTQYRITTNAPTLEHRR